MCASPLPFYDNIYITHSFLPKAKFPSEFMIMTPSFSPGNLLLCNTFLTYICNCSNSICFSPLCRYKYAQAFMFFKKKKQQQMKKERKQKDACCSQFYNRNVTILKVYPVNSKYRR